MAAVNPQSHGAVLEDGVEAVLPEPQIGEGEEFVDLVRTPAKKEDEPPIAAPKKAAAAPVKKEPEPAAGDDDLPDDLKGKTPAQIAKMLKDAQSLIGRQGSELGELRKKADTAILASLETLRERRVTGEPEPKKAAPEPEMDDTEFFAKPKETIAKAIASHPLIKEIRETLGKAAADRESQRAQDATTRFNAAHPDAKEILDDPEFLEWIGASRVRSELLRRAHTKFDFDAGDELFGTWKALRGIKPKAAPLADVPDAETVSDAARTLAAAKRKQQLKDAATPTSGSAGGSKEGGSKKIYRRADVIRLMEEDPERYEALAPEIEKAYREGRVR